MNMKFKLADLKAMAEKSIAEKKSLIIVKDDGAYLMLHDKPKNLVVYAKGMSPDDPWIGGDDFGEDLNVADKIIEMIIKGFKTLIVTVTPTQFEMKYSNESI